jgi:tRNA(Arg) A34 adenosine deaminase TadA
MSFHDAWEKLAPPVRRSLELAHHSLIAGGLAVGAVLTDAQGAIVAEGRNRAYDPPGGSDALQGSPLAHAEMNVLAAARTGWDLSGYTLWSTHEPCPMCGAAAVFTEIGTVRYVAPDPWAVAERAGSGPESSTTPIASPLGDPRWSRVAGLLFVLAVADQVGPNSLTVTANPELARLALDLLPAPTGGSLADLIAPLWPRISTN